MIRGIDQYDNDNTMTSIVDTLIYAYAFLVPR
jgi:hypothetical protein